jgi:hypothetical protein
MLWVELGLHPQPTTLYFMHSKISFSRFSFIFFIHFSPYFTILNKKTQVLKNSSSLKNFIKLDLNLGAQAIFISIINTEFSMLIEHIKEA